MCPHDPDIMQPYYEAVGWSDMAPLTVDEITNLSNRLRNESSS
jgi:hypothetical protein